MITISFVLRKEIKIFLIIFCFCNLVNASSIYIYATQWKELYTELGIVTGLSFFLYLLLAIIRSILRWFKNRSQRFSSPGNPNIITE